MWILVLCVVTPRRLFLPTFRSSVSPPSSALNVETIRSSKTSVNARKSTRLHNPEDQNSQMNINWSQRGNCLRRHPALIYWTRAYPAGWMNLDTKRFIRHATVPSASFVCCHKGKNNNSFYMYPSFKSCKMLQVLSLWRLAFSALTGIPCVAWDTYIAFYVPWGRGV
jgi:hypothetical protein